VVGFLLFGAILTIPVINDLGRFGTLNSANIGVNDKPASLYKITSATGAH
jgi:hypothetical protein